ncbi:unnamed protein product [Oppiella nova]|uniref:Ezrin/radixin/moesin C-terminal domain-containing protein n=1 Tax=Oppiella nova TaxID=334625 RepID=A0A7R9LN28_9ACAR|nr:unnamed protein product [Oppiella nova]CAG2165260.1 unnamed protein product [Oppiella nova]
MPKAVNVRVTTMDAELEFAIQPNTTGKQLFDQVVKTIGVQFNGDGDGDSAIDVPRPEEERETEVSKKKDLQEQLKLLQQDLALSKDDSKVTKNDVLHEENVRQGRDKYKTLRDIRKGNTKRRVDQFENM